MKWYTTLLVLILGTCVGWTQGQDPDLLLIKSRLDSIAAFTADLDLEVDVSFINMPPKQAQLHYRKEKPLQFSSEDFVLIPKRGFDFSLEGIFKYPFITVDRGEETHDGIRCKRINVIPTTDKADFSIAELLMDVERHRILESKISTKKEGTYALKMAYEDAKAILPKAITIAFEISRIKIPLNYMGKDTQIDRKQMKEEEVHQGKIYLKMSNYQIQREAK